MDARLIRPAVLAALLLVSMVRDRSANFIVETADPQMAARICEAAEQFRHDLAIEWLGQAMPNWAQPCMMTVQVAPRLGAGGATTFVFDNGEVFGWRMTIQGSAERVLDSVLPHEITHMVFASYFRRPLPRWVKTLVDEFTAFARFPASKPAPAQVNDILEDALNVFAGRLDGISLQRDLSPICRLCWRTRIR